MSVNLRKILSAVLIGLMILPLASGCENSDVPSGSDSSNNGTVIKYPNDGLVSVYPEETNEILNNPQMGLYFIENAPLEVTDLGRKGTFPDINTVAVLSSWGEIEEIEGKYDWTIVDNAVNYWKSKGKRIIFRISTDAMVISGLMKYSSEVPAWLFDKYKVGYQNREMQGVFYRVPDYADPVYLDKLQLFMDSFAGKYKDDPAVEGVMLLGYGPWGEWHSGHDFKSYDEREKTLAKIIDIWAEAWGSETPLFLSSTYEYDQTLFPAVSDPASYEEYMRWSAFDHAWNIPNVSFARNGVAGALKDYDSRLLMDSFASGKRVPVQLELFGGYEQYSAIGGHAGYDTESAFDEILMYRANVMTIMGWDKFGLPRLYNERPDLIYKMNRYLGYRLIPKDFTYPARVAPGTDFDILHTWVNDAVGRCPEDHDLRISLIDDAGNEIYSVTDSNFAPSNMTYGNIYSRITEYKIPEGTAEGEYQLKIAVTDKTGDPAIKLGITGNNGKDEYIAGKILIDNEAEEVKAFFEDSKIKTDLFSVKDGEDTSVDVGLQGGKAYEISFDYKAVDPDAVMSFAVKSETGGPSASKAVNMWTDVSMLKSGKTYVVLLEEHDDHRLVFSSEGGSAEFSGIRVREVDMVFAENAESGDMESVMLSAAEDAIVTEEPDDVLGGKYSLALQGSGIGDSDMLATFEGAFKFKPNTSYTVSFDYKTVTDARQGSYAYMELRSGDKVRNHFFWADLVSNGRYTKTFRFTTDDTEGYNIYFGIHNSLSVVIDNIVITENGEGVRLISGDEDFVPPVRNDDIEELEFPVSVDFEEGDIFDAGFLSGDMSFGDITDNSKAVIGGEYSVVGDSDGAILWYNFLSTDPRKIVFKENTEYTVEFDYRVLRKQQNEGGFMVYARTSAGTLNDDRGYVLWNAWGRITEKGPDMADSDIRIREDRNGNGSVHMVFATANKSDYSLYFCIKYGGAFSVDNVWITEGRQAAQGSYSVPAMKDVKLDMFGFAEDFEGGPMNDGNAGLFRRTMVSGGTTYSRDAENFYGSFTSDKSRVINGNYSLLGSTNVGTWFDVLRSNSARAPIYDGQNYSIKFKYKPEKLAANAHYYFVLKSNSGNFAYDKYVWWNQRTNVIGSNLGALDYTLTDKGDHCIFEVRITPQWGPGNYYLVWGINGGGEIVIDDIVVSVNDAKYDFSRILTWENIVGKEIR